MASIIILDEGTPKERSKILYDVPTLNGTRKRKSKTFRPGTSKRDINAFKRKVEMDLEQNYALDYSGQKKTFGQFVEECFSMYLTNLSPTTLIGYESMYANTGMKDYLSHIPIDKISFSTMQSYVNYMQFERHYSPKTIRNHVFFISKIFRIAIQCQLINHRDNPTEYLMLPSMEKKDVNFYTVEQIQKFLTVAKQECDPAYLIIALGALTGMRKGELAALKWNRCYLENGLQEIHVVENKIRLTNKGVITKSPKTASGRRIIQLGDGIANILRQAKKEQQKRSLLGKTSVRFTDESYVIVQPSGECYMPDSLYGAYRRFVLAHPEIAPFYRLHSLRNTFATLSSVADSSSNTEILKYQMGHSHQAMTHAYIGTHEDAKKQSAKKLNDLFFGASEVI